VALPDSFEVVQRLTVTLCRNGVCVQGPIIERAAPLAPGNSATTRLDSKAIPTRFVVCTVHATDTGFRADLRWAEQTSELTNGDRYQVVLRDASHAPLLNAKRRVTYSETYPNGKECDLEPCKTAVVELE
jgi:hypothetical protein